MKHLLIFTLLIITVISCTTEKTEKMEFAIAIHGGAGVISKNISDDVRDGYLESLRKALELGQNMLAGGMSSIDVVEAVVQVLEEDPLFNAGRGSVFTNKGTHELDASIMDGRTLACGAVAGLTTVKSPVHLARKVMEETRHVFMAGTGAEDFATAMGVERVDNSYFSTENRRNALERARQQEAGSVNLNPDEIKANSYGTVGAVALDKDGNLAAATSTGGMTNKRYGRIGDVPVIGAGTYANNKTAAVSCTGTGEEFIRHAVAHQISAIMEYTGVSLTDAANQVVHGKLKPGDGGIISISHTGEIAMVFNSPGMFRGAADSKGRFEIAIWED